MELVIRDAGKDDYKAIAKIHVQAWQKAYKDLVPDSYLKNLSIEKSEAGWKRRLIEGLHKVTLVAIDAENRVLGYCCGGDNSEEPCEYDGELQAIYIHPDYRGMGIGKVLFNRFKKELQDIGYNSLIIWCLRESKSLLFYQKMEGELLTEKIYTIGGKELVGVSLGWDLNS